MQYPNYDIAIVGGGLAGLICAIALARLNYRIALVEAKPLEVEIDTQQTSQPLALSYATYLLLNEWEMWADLANAAVAIEDIHVSQRGHWGRVLLRSEENDVPALGYVISSAVLMKHFLSKVLSLKEITIFANTRLIGFTKEAQGFSIRAEDDTAQHQLNAKVMIAADGVHSSIRSLVNIGIEERDYQQTAVITQVEIGQDHQGCAYERFDERGPIALLPLAGKKMGLVWVVNNQDVELLVNLKPEAFLKKLQMHFGYRVGRFKTMENLRQYPLKMVIAKETAREGLILIGNAAHTLHPVAGQGFNLGIRDVAAMVRLLEQGKTLDELSKAYELERKSDQQKIAHFSDSLATYFSFDVFPIPFLRSIGLSLLSNLPWAKRRFARHAMGLFDLP